MPRVVGTVDDHVEEVRKVGAELATADAVALGEHHRTPSVHRTHLALIEAMHEKRPNMVIAMEMFERDVQVDLDQYLGGVIDEATFRERSRPWPDYDVDYRPVIEFAKANGIVMPEGDAPSSPSDTIEDLPEVIVEVGERVGPATRRAAQGRPSSPPPGPPARNAIFDFGRRVRRKGHRS